MIGDLRRFWRGRSGAVAAEFALVVPIFLAFIFGVIDVGRAMWTWNRAEKATEAGVRFAVATNTLPTGLSALDLIGVSAGGSTIGEGQVIPESAFGKLSCDRTTCACITAPCYGITAMNSAAFDAMLARMQGLFPEIEAANVRVDYSSAGLGYAGDPFASDVTPLVTVRLVDMTFQPTTLLVFRTTLDLPGFPATLTLEDGAGGLSH
jgi:Flp pilus assembly pilin Flp